MSRQREHPSTPRSLTSTLSSRSRSSCRRRSTFACDYLPAVMYPLLVGPENATHNTNFSERCSELARAFNPDCFEPLSRMRGLCCGDADVDGAMTRLAFMLTTVPLERDPRARRATAAAECRPTRPCTCHPPSRERSSAVASAARPSAARSRAPWPRAHGSPGSGHTATAALGSRATQPRSCARPRHARGGLAPCASPGARLVYDAHELYSGFDADPPRLWRWLSLRLEGLLAGAPTP